VEQVLGFNENYPLKTVLRSMNAQTLTLGWCMLIDQQTEWLQYSAATGAVVAYGWMGVEEGTGVIVLDDACQGAVIPTRLVMPIRWLCYPVPVTLSLFHVISLSASARSSVRPFFSFGFPWPS
jgi:hypothetical protein